MRIISSLDVLAEAKDATVEHWLYNGMDAAITFEAWREMRKKPAEVSPEFERSTNLSYSFARGMMAPALDMMFRGVKINLNRRAEIVYALKKELERLDLNFNKIMRLGFGVELNPRSYPQLKKFFYETFGTEERLRYDKQTKENVVTVDREAIEDIAENEILLRPVCAHILAMRDKKKLLDVAESGVRSTGRMHCTYAVVGTSTQRWASYEDAFGYGTNLQNITDEMREMFVADSGMKLGYADLSQAESVATAYISGDPAYIEACTSGDIHTSVARMIDPSVPWTGDLKKDRELAEVPFFRHYSRRDGTKACGHATNYDGADYAIYKNLMKKGIYFELAYIREFQTRYFRAFPGIKDWHGHIERQLAEHKYVENPFGHRMYFFGRTNDPTVIKKAIAAVPQSTIGQLLNLGLYRIWKANVVQLLLQVHDCIIFQFPDTFEHEQRAMEHVLSLLKIPVPVTDIRGVTRTMLVNADGATGWNWRKVEKRRGESVINPHGLLKWVPNVPDSRTAPEYSLLHRRVYQTN